jgi:hypothetical protein
MGLMHQAKSKLIRFIRHLANLNLVKHLAKLITMNFEASKDLLAKLFVIIVTAIKQSELLLMELEQHFMCQIKNSKCLNHPFIMG